MRASFSPVGLAALLSALALGGCDALLGEEPARPQGPRDAASPGRDAGRADAGDAGSAPADAQVAPPDAQILAPDASTPDGGAPPPDGGGTVPDAAAPGLDASAHSDASICLPSADGLDGGPSDATADGLDAGPAGDSGCTFPSYICATGCCTRAVGAGGNHSCATNATGAVACWGAWGAAESGAIPTKVLGASAVSAIAAGWAFTCAIDTDKSLDCWGTNQFGELGIGSWTLDPIWTATSTLLGSHALAAAAGRGHACAINGAGTVLCWGANDRYQLGLGGPPSTAEPTPRPVSWGQKAIGIAVGYENTCAIAYIDTFVGGALYCWGPNGMGQIGDSSFLLRRTPWPVPAMETGVTAVAVGHAHACAVKDGKVFCWGVNDHYQAAYGGASCDTSLRLCLTASEVTTPAPAVDVVAGLNHTCALLETRKVVCWGSNAVGQAGHDSACQGDVIAPTEVAGLDDVSQISAGLDHTCAVRKDQIYCWGSNADGQLGTYPATLPESRRPVLVPW